jgi:DNA-binding LacI/PurR family transcriptional regulator
MVVTDDVEGGRIATRHLVELGHRRIAFIGDDRDEGFGFTSSPLREQGYEAVLAEEGLAYDPDLVRHGYHERDVAQRLAGELLTLADPPTAVFASSDVQATGTIAAARALGLRVPEDLSVVGFDDIELAAYAGLTTVRQPLFESGRLGAELLLAAVQGDEKTLVEEVHELPLELVERATTAPPSREATARG